MKIKVQVQQITLSDGRMGGSPIQSSNPTHIPSAMDRTAGSHTRQADGLPSRYIPMSCSVTPGTGSHTAAESGSVSEMDTCCFSWQLEKFCLSTGF